jgi:putative peptidoglycan lipid II flippase
VLLLMAPASLGLAVVQINVVVDKLLASWAASWAPAALFYSERIVYFPLGIFATALGTVLLPVFSDRAAERDDAGVRLAVQHALRNLLFVMIPASLGLLVLASPVVRAIFQWRSFGPESTRQTAVALQFYAPGLIAFSLVKVLVPVFYGRQDTRTPVLVGLAAVALNLVLNVAFVLTWPAPIKHAGLALATVLSSAMNGIVLGWLLHRRVGSPGWRSIGVGAARASACAAGMALVLALSRQGLRTATAGLPQRPGEVAFVAISVTVGVAVYLGLAALIRAPELADLSAAIRRRR